MRVGDGSLRGAAEERADGRPVSRYSAKSFGLSRGVFPRRVLDVVEVLHDRGYESYIVGGGVRDFLLGYKPKDFDVATSARPEQVAALFPRCRVIGKRFRLAHVRDPRDRREITEVATFRASLGESGDSVVENKRIVRDNVYGSLEDDVLRRDFTVNSMYYNPFSDELVCHSDAPGDIKSRRLRSIGDPWARYHEDPVRMLRAIRFTAKLGLKMAPEVTQQIHALAPLITEVSSARLFEETIKLFHSGASLRTYELLQEYGLFGMLYPGAGGRLKEDRDEGSRERFLRALFTNTDARVGAGKPVSPAFILAALFWLGAEHLRQGAERRRVALSWHQAVGEAWKQQQRHVSSPRRLTAVARAICLLQKRFESRRSKHLHFVFNHPRFRAAYDFLCLRADSGMGDRVQAEWWTQFQETDQAGRRKMLHERTGGRRRKRR